MACGILDPQTGMQPTPPAFKVLGLYYWTAREVPLSDFSFFKQSLLHMNSSMPKAFANSDEQQAVLTPTVWGSNSSWGRQEAEQKTAKESLGNMTLRTGGFKKLWHIPENLKGHMHMQGYAHA